MTKQKSKNSIKRKKVNFSAYFPEASAVSLVGDFNNWGPQKHPMKKDEKGDWKKYLLLYPGTYEYKFKVDDHWENDRTNPLTCPNDFGTKNNFIILD